MATTDIRLQRVNDEYQSVRRAQDAVLDKVDGFESAILGLTENVSRNGDRIDALDRRIDLLDDKLDAIIKHLDVPYKPPAGFVKE